MRKGDWAFKTIELRAKSMDKARLTSIELLALMGGAFFVSLVSLVGTHFLIRLIVGSSKNSGFVSVAAGAVVFCVLAVGGKKMILARREKSAGTQEGQVKEL